MSLWDRLFTGAKPPTMDHHVFGKITFMRLKPPGRMLVRAYAGWIPGSGPRSGLGRFTLDSVSIPDSIDGSHWELVYACTDDDDHTFTILMNGWAPAAEARIDGSPPRRGLARVPLGWRPRRGRQIPAAKARFVRRLIIAD